MTVILGIGAVMMIAPICIGITLYYSAKATDDIGRLPKDG
jgi:hypothetical protein